MAENRVRYIKLIEIDGLWQAADKESSILLRKMGFNNQQACFSSISYTLRRHITDYGLLLEGETDLRLIVRAHKNANHEDVNAS